MSPNDPVTREELEDRLDRLRSDFLASQLQQDTAFNHAVAKMREDFVRGIEVIRSDLRGFVTEQYLSARLTPIQNIAYGLVAFLAAATAYRFLH